MVVMRDQNHTFNKTRSLLDYRYVEMLSWGKNKDREEQASEKIISSRVAKQVHVFLNSRAYIENMWKTLKFIGF